MSIHWQSILANDVVLPFDHNGRYKGSVAGIDDHFFTVTCLRIRVGREGYLFQDILILDRTINFTEDQSIVRIPLTKWHSFHHLVPFLDQHLRSVRHIV